jgi:primosomal protein N' (replication factor Y)
MADECNNLLESGWEILGPAPASVMRVARRYRWQILLKSTAILDSELPQLNRLRSFLSQSVSMTIDVDPINID